jgi:pyroglutamyl-peptidase
VRFPALALAIAGLAGACVDAPGDEVANDPNAGLLRDFQDGKFDSAGHPLNAKVIDAASTSCGAPLRGACEIELPENATSYGITISARVRVRQAPSSGRILTIEAVDAGGGALGDQQLTVDRLRATDYWFDLPLTLDGGGATRVVLDVAPGATVDFQYLEVFPKRLDVVLAPGSGIYADGDRFTIELPKGKQVEALQADGLDVLPTLQRLLDEGKATRTTTEFRTIVDVGIGDLLPARGDVTELRVHSQGDTSRAQLRRTPQPCAFEGDPTGAKVVITGFQPFPADESHDNISGVAVRALDPSTLRGAQVMRVILPVEYDRAAALVDDVIRRCQPSAVISFGQGGDAIALEETAYNLQDTGELATGAPDNRGIIRAATPILAGAEATRSTLLPLDAIKSELEAAGEQPQYSTDPGRYICNNVMFADVGAMASRGRAGFIHLPNTTEFDAAARARWGNVVRIAVETTVSAR